MRLKDYPEKDDGKRVWLEESEIQAFIDEAESPMQRAAFLLGVRLGLRGDEIRSVTPSHFIETDVGRILRIWNGKGDKYREVPVAPELGTIVDTVRYDLDPDDLLVDRASSTLYRWVQRAGERRYAATGDEGWTYLGPHDLRRTWGVRLLEDGVLASVVFEWGGWESWETFRDHYLTEFSPEAIRRERAKVDSLREPGQPIEQGSMDDYVTAAQSASPSLDRSRQRYP